MHLFVVELFASLPSTTHTLNSAVLKVLWLISGPCSQYSWQLTIHLSSLVCGKIVDFLSPINYKFTRLMSLTRGDAVSLFFGRLVPFRTVLVV